MSTAIVCKPGCDVMNFAVNFIFLIKPFFLNDKKPWQKLKYIENKKSFYDEIKSIFHYFLKGFQSSKYHKFFWKLRVRL